MSCKLEFKFIWQLHGAPFYAPLPTSDPFNSPDTQPIMTPDPCQAMMQSENKVNIISWDMMMLSRRKMW